MSLATLKRKTNNGNPRNAPISGKGHLGFALNGTLRVPSMGKSTNLGRRQARTPFRGTEPMGHGGGWRGRLNLPTSKVGTYERNLHFSGLCCTKNDDEIVKTSVKNTKGMIETRYSGTLHSAYNKDRITYDEDGNPIVPPINWVQPIDNGYQQHHTQGQYIMAKHANNDSVSHYSLYLENGPLEGHKYSCNSGFPCSWFVGSKKMIVGHGVSASSGGPYAKSLNGRGAISQSQYLQGAFMKYKNNLPTTLSKNHFPMNVIRNGCDVNAITIEQAIAKGLMPKQHENVICNREARIDPGLCLHHNRYTLTGHDKKYDNNKIILSYDGTFFDILHRPKQPIIIAFIFNGGKTPNSEISENIFSNLVLSPVNDVYRVLLKTTTITGVMYDLQGDNYYHYINSKFTFNDITTPYTTEDYNLNEYVTLGYTVYPTKYIQIPVTIIK